MLFCNECSSVMDTRREWMLFGSGCSSEMDAFRKGYERKRMNARERTEEEITEEEKGEGRQALYTN